MSGGLPFLRSDFESPRTDVQATTFSIDALGRYICNTWDEATGPASHGDVEADFEVVVIGSGMYGAACANRLRHLGRRVLVLEAGPFLVSEHVQNLSRIGLNIPAAIPPEAPEASRARELVWGTAWRGNQITPGQAYCVGGKSLYWGGWSPRLTDDVLASWPAAARDYLTATYPHTELQIGVTEQRPGDSVPSIGTDFIDETGLQTALMARMTAVAPVGLEAPRRAPVAVQGQAPASGLFGFDKYASLPLLIDAIREDVGRAGGVDRKRGLFLVPKCRVLRLETVGGAVRRLQVFTDGRFRALAIPPACQIVLACGCIDSTRLALESFPTPAMGRNLMVHLRSNFVARVPRGRLGLAPGPVQTAAVHVPARSTAGGRYHIQVVAGANRDGDGRMNAEALWFRTIPDRDVLNDILRNQENDLVALQFRSCGEMLGIRDVGSPDRAVSWIDLSPFERDEFGLHRPYVHLTTLPQDDALWDEMDEVALHFAERLGDGDTEFWLTDASGQGRWAKQRPSAGLLWTEGEPRGIRDPLGTTYHESGTLWMGENPATSVTTPQGRFHHISNAWCVDQSIFPRVGSANPVLTGLVLARHAAEAIAGLPRIA